MKKISAILFVLMLFSWNQGFGQSTSFKTYINPVIPGDHPDCTVMKVGNGYYTTGSSFNPTPVIYYSTDLVHWKAIAQPVSADWAGYGNKPGGGCWGGQVVYHNNQWWDFFSHNNQMYFVTADSVSGTWSMPTLMNTPTGVPGLGYDNSIFIDSDGSWYLLVKNGQTNNWIVQLGINGQPRGKVLNLTWLNPSPSYPYSWAEGPVMWKHDGFYYYAFAKNVAGGEYVMRSKTLTDNQSSWSKPTPFFNLSDRMAYTSLFINPNHNSAVVIASDSTCWVLTPGWRTANNNEWYGQGRQGQLCQVHYNSNGMPVADYPDNISMVAPKLPSSGIPWTVPHSDFFDSDKLNPEWSFLGYTPAGTYSLSMHPGWLTLKPRGRGFNTIIKNDAEHNYSLITRLTYNPKSISDEAGLWVFNGNQTKFAKLYKSVDSAGNKIVAFGFESSYYKVKTTGPAANDSLWLKLVRVNHVLTGYYSSNGYDWIKVGKSINVADMDGLQPNYNSWTGNRQGLFVQGSAAQFDFYIYRDAYTPIPAQSPANYYGTIVSSSRISGVSSLNVHNNDWALFAGVEFGKPAEYPMQPDSIRITASCASEGGAVQVWLDSLDTGTEIADCNITNTGSTDTYHTFTAPVLKPVSGNHDVYLKFSGSGTSQLFQLKEFRFSDNSRSHTTPIQQYGQIPKKFMLDQNYPNPFNPSTVIRYQLPVSGKVSLRVFDSLGREVASLVHNQWKTRGVHTVTFNASGLSSGIYFYRLKAGDFTQTKKMILLK